MRKRYRRRSPLLVIGLVLLGTGCAATLSAVRPEARNVYVFEPGTPREEVHAAMGAPIVSHSHYGEIQDFFEVEQGITEGERRNRALLHTTLFFATIGYWDLAAVPYEMWDTEILRVEVRYDEMERVASATVFTGDVDVPGVARREDASDGWFDWSAGKEAFAARIGESFATPTTPMSGGEVPVF